MSRVLSPLILATLGVLASACGDKEPADGDVGSADDTGGSAGDDTGDTDEPVGVCASLGLEERAFDATEPGAWQRWQPAGDFSVALLDGSTWTLSEQWTGCDTYIFLPYGLATDEKNSESWWFTGVDELIERSPPNVHYFFVVEGRSSNDAEEFGPLMADEISAALAGLDTTDFEWWQDRLHVVDGPSAKQEGLVREMFAGAIGYFGFGIDRRQRIRTLGYPPDVEAYDSSMSWPWSNELYSAASEAIYWNFEEERELRLEAVDADIYEVFGGDVYEQYEDGTLSLPDPATMAAYDTLEIDVLIECPDKDAQEISNCGAWDYLAYMWLYDEDTESWLEMGRFITTYHRESRWVVDGSHALAWLQDGGDRTVRFEWAPSWNTQPSGITLQVRLSNQGKGVAPRAATAIFSGGGISSTFNDDRPAVEVEIPADATKVELVSIATGHGMDSSNCAEFCEHAHNYSVGSETWTQDLAIPDPNTGCREDVGNGTVPNQAGTWWFGRAGWCPGKRVDPFVVDITEQVSPGSTATVSYELTVMGSAPKDSQGSAELRSWLVFSN